MYVHFYVRYHEETKQRQLGLRVGATTPFGVLRKLFPSATMHWQTKHGLKDRKIIYGCMKWIDTENKKLQRKNRTDITRSSISTECWVNIFTLSQRTSTSCPIIVLIIF